MARGMLWVQADIDLMGTLSKSGWTDKAIADVVGRTPSAVMSKRAELGQMKRTGGGGNRLVNKAIRAACLRMRFKLSASQIGERLGISRNAVIGHWHRERMRETRQALSARAA